MTLSAEMSNSLSYLIDAKGTNALYNSFMDLDTSGTSYQGREYRYALGITSQIFFCGIPFRFDSSPKCTLNCLYCFAMTRGGRRSSTDLLARSEKLIRKIERAQISPDGDINSELIHRKLPIHFGGMSDPFSTKTTTSISMRVLEKLKEFDYPVVLSTKQTRYLETTSFQEIARDYKNLIIQISISSINEKFTKRIEPCAPTPFERLKTIHNLSRLGIPIIARIQPFFPWLADEVGEELIPALAQSGVNHAVVEFLKLPVEESLFLNNEFSNAINLDIRKYYKENQAIVMSREWLFPTEKKWEILQPIINSIHKSGMTYGAGDYGLNHLGDTQCCCGIDKFEGFENYFRSFSSFFAKKKCEYKFTELISNDLPTKSIKMYLNSRCRMPGENTIYNVLRRKWNSPKTVNAPDSFLGMKFTGEKDDYGDCIYVKSEV